MNAFKYGILVLALLVTSGIYSQTTITGTVVDEVGALPGASVLEMGTNNGTTTDFEGSFSLTVESSEGELEISFLGYDDYTISYSGTSDLGVITLTESANALEEVVITGTIDIAKDRQTPVAVSTVRAV
ncbi:MAG: carboxypeptidase-like regulatory domain-containing protein, partial [Thermodesulfobacteriota bacterium]|nr:carboxypeptidase-like regulatory domain-containing protein [Thermodesulfobacteriota bacterium]